MLKSILKPELKKWFEKVAAQELYASNLYKFMANQMQRMGFFGLQGYFAKESLEELNHYQKLADYVNDLQDVLGVPAVPKIDEDVTDIGKALMIAYEFEHDLMGMYQDFYEASEKAGDCVTASFLIEFMQIQRKSVGEYGDFISRYEQNPKDVFEFDEYFKD